MLADGPNFYSQFLKAVVAVYFCPLDTSNSAHGDNACDQVFSGLVVVELTGPATWALVRGNGLSQGVAMAQQLVS